MPVRIEKVPEELKCFLPESNTDTVVIGRNAYELAPLTASVAEQVSAELIEIAATVFQDVASLFDGTSTPKNMREVLSLADVLKSGLTGLIKGQRIQRIVAVALDLSLEQVQKEATVKQLYHALGCIWKQNLDFAVSVPEDSRKNFDSLLVSVGLKSRDDAVYQWADLAIRVLSSPQAGSPQERIVMALQSAIEMKLVSNSEANHILSSGCMRTSPEPSASPESTSTVPAVSPVPSLEPLAHEGSLTSANAPSAPVTASPNGSSPG